MQNTSNLLISESVHNLVLHLCSSDVINQPVVQDIESRTCELLKNTNTMYFLKKEDIDNEIDSMAEKFMFHGCRKQADKLKRSYQTFIVCSKVANADLTSRLNIVKFLLTMSTSPTNYFWDHPDEFLESDSCETSLNWGDYLKDGIVLKHYSDDSSISDLSDSAEESNKIGTSQLNHTPSIPLKIPIIKDNDIESYLDLGSSRKELLNTIQHGSYHDSNAYLNTMSTLREARIGILWEEHLQRQTKGLIPLPKTSFISEYKAIREILFQFFAVHNSSLFQLERNQITIRQNVTIPSVRAPTFKLFLEEFLPYIEVLDEFRQFERLIYTTPVPQTLKSYGYSLTKIIKPIYTQLIALEEVIRMQNTIMTVLQLAVKCKEIFSTLMLLKKIHLRIMEVYREKLAFLTAVNILSELRRLLNCCSCKTEQDLILTIYLDSLYYYLNVIDHWLMKDDFYDDIYSKEFVITRSCNYDPENSINHNLTTKSDSWELGFKLRSGLDEVIRSNGLLHIICTKVLNIGRNLCLLRQLGILDPIGFFSEGIHVQFVEGVLRKVADFHQQILPLQESNNVEETSLISTNDNCGENLKNFEELIDVKDDLLMTVFNEFFQSTTNSDSSPSTAKTLYERICSLTTNIFPVQNLFETVFFDILREHFLISGLLVKNTLMEKYDLDKLFMLLQHLFLFHNDLVFPFYRRFFDKIQQPTCVTSIWLTSHLQYVIMDAYPNFYQKCAVQIDSMPRSSNHSLEFCRRIHVQLTTEWPLNLIVTNVHIVMYNQLFQFILMIKWALYSLNHLKFSDVNLKGTAQKASSHTHIPSEKMLKKLKFLRFSMLNLLTNIQHYIFGYIFTLSQRKFELDFEKSSDLKSIVTTHSVFINSCYIAINEIIEHEKKTQFLNGVQQFVIMWCNINTISHEKLKFCYKVYKNTLSVLNPTLHPTTH